MIDILKSMDLLKKEHSQDIEELIKQEQSTIEQNIFTKEILEEISKKYKLAVISNLGYDYGEKALAAINHPLDHIIFSYQTGHMKPEKEIFERLISESGLRPHEILHVGDSYMSDFIGARNAGMQAIHLDLKNKNKASHHISNIGELINFI